MHSDNRIVISDKIYLKRDPGSGYPNWLWSFCATSNIKQVICPCCRHRRAQGQTAEERKKIRFIRGQ